MNDINKILIYKVDPNIPTPNVAHPGEDLGIDLYSGNNYTVNARSYQYIDTGIRISFPSGIGGMIANRSSKGYKSHLLVYPGIIDSGYTGQLLLKMYNLSDEPIYIKQYEKIAQLILLPVYAFPIEVVDLDTFESTDISNRKTNGFGSTGS